MKQNLQIEQESVGNQWQIQNLKFLRYFSLKMFSCVDIGKKNKPWNRPSLFGKIPYLKFTGIYEMETPTEMGSVEWQDIHNISKNEIIENCRSLLSFFVYTERKLT